MGVDIGIYCTVDKEKLKEIYPPDEVASILDWVEDLNGDPLISADVLTDYDDYRGHRVHKLPNWIGELLWIVEEVMDGTHPEIKKVYIRDDCDGDLLEATPDNVAKVVKMFCEGKFFGVFNVEGSFKNWGDLDVGT